MSYVLHIAGDAVSDLRSLQPWLQEEVLDELDRVAARAHTLRSDRYGEFVHDFERRSEGHRYVAFVRLQRNTPLRTVTVLAVAVSARPLPAG